MRSCKQCRREGEYDERYDALFCERCKVWLEEGCTDPTCTYCAHRPAVPPGLPKYVPPPPPKSLGTLRDARWVTAARKPKPPRQEASRRGVRAQGRGR